MIEVAPKASSLSLPEAKMVLPQTSRLLRPSYDFPKNWRSEKGLFTISLKCAHSRDCSFLFYGGLGKQLAGEEIDLDV